MDTSDESVDELKGDGDHSQDTDFISQGSF